MMIRHSSKGIEQWNITKWEFKGKTIQFTFNKNRNYAHQLTGWVTVDRDIPSMTLTTKWEGRDDLPDKNVLLLPESRIVNALKDFETQTNKPPNKPLDTSQ
jgi:hypothetical protein